MRFRPGGVLLARLVTTGTWLALDEAEAEAADDGTADRPALVPAAGDRAGGAGAGRGVARTERAGPDVPSRSADGPACTAPHGMTEAPGPPSKATAITTTQASMTADKTRPACFIRRNRRPE